MVIPGVRNLLLGALHMSAIFPPAHEEDREPDTLRASFHAKESISGADGLSDGPHVLGPRPFRPLTDGIRDPLSLP